MEKINPIMRADYPDPDVIRVGDTYYMISTTMHFMPGGVILRSYDLVHWEIVSYVFDGLDGTLGQRLEGGRQIITGRMGGGRYSADPISCTLSWITLPAAVSACLCIQHGRREALHHFGTLSMKILYDKKIRRKTSW